MSLQHLRVSRIIFKQAQMSCSKSLMAIRLKYLLSFIAFIKHKFNYKYIKFYAVNTIGNIYKNFI